MHSVEGAQMVMLCGNENIFGWSRISEDGNRKWNHQFVTICELQHVHLARKKHCITRTEHTDIIYPEWCLRNTIGLYEDNTRRDICLTM